MYTSVIFVSVLVSERDFVSVRVFLGLYFVHVCVVFGRVGVVAPLKARGGRDVRDLGFEGFELRE